MKAQVGLLWRSMELGWTVYKEESPKGQGTLGGAAPALTFPNKPEPLGVLLESLCLVFRRPCLKDTADACVFSGILTLLIVYRN